MAVSLIGGKTRVSGENHRPAQITDTLYHIMFYLDINTLKQGNLKHKIWKESVLFGVISGITKHVSWFISTFNGHQYSSPSILRYCISYKTTFFKKNNCEVISKRILIIFASEEAEIFLNKNSLTWFSVRMPLFSYDLKTIFVFWRQICYIF